MTLIAEYSDRIFVIDEHHRCPCRVTIIDGKQRGSIYINRDDAQKAIKALQEFIDSEGA